VIAHEAPIYAVIDDAAERDADVEQMIAAHEAGDVLGAWAIFMRSANIELPEGALEHMFGGDRDEQAIADERRFFRHELRATTRWRPDLAVLRRASTRVVIGVGEESAGELCDRTSAGLADALGTRPVRFPGGHVGFVDAPDAFAARLRPLLEDR
jgi:pimeloyl-ACP methyl ester carboxylesterase